MSEASLAPSRRRLASASSPSAWLAAASFAAEASLDGCPWPSWRASASRTRARRAFASRN
ncbi:MAG: hypothetical protein LBQ12_13745 [Deltaproteobacteria bacterium]|nr:hypothetical protein [Deltaproteobacteria bacterium]